jgi:hypothetical protein
MPNLREGTKIGIQDGSPSRSYYQHPRARLRWFSDRRKQIFVSVPEQLGCGKRPFELEPSGRRSIGFPVMGHPEIPPAEDGEPQPEGLSRTTLKYAAKNGD